MKATDYFVGKQAEAKALLVRAKASEAKLSQGAEVVTKEQLAVIPNRDTVKNSMNTYFAKVSKPFHSR